MPGRRFKGFCSDRDAIWVGVQLLAGGICQVFYIRWAPLFQDYAWRILSVLLNFAFLVFVVEALASEYQ